MTDEIPDERPMASEVVKAATSIADLLSTGDRQALYIERWEAMWTEELPKAARECAEMASAVLNLDRELTPEEAEGMGEVMSKTSDMLHKIANMQPPNPDLICLYYLRRIHAKLEEDNGISY